MNKILIVLLLLGFGACTSKKTAGENPREFRIGITTAGDIPDSLRLISAFDSAASAADGEILWKSAHGSEAEQEKGVEGFIQQGVNGVIMEPVNPLTAGALIARARQKGIPVVPVFSMPVGEQALAFVMPDFEEGARMLADYAIDRARRDGRGIIFLSELADSSEEQLARAITGFLTKKGVNVWIDRLSFDSVEARHQINTAIYDPSVPAAVFTTRPVYALIAADLLRLQLVTPRPLVLSYGCPAAVRNALVSGAIDAAVDTNPDSVAVRSFQAMIHIIRRLPVSADVRRYGSLLVPTIRTRVSLKTRPNTE